MKAKFKECTELLARTLKSLVFPEYCPGCGIEWEVGEGFICSDCWSNLKPYSKPFWDYNPALEGRVIIALSYEDPTRRIIHQMKFYGRPDIAQRLGMEIGSRLRSNLLALGNASIIPVPLHTVRIRERGFDQNLAIASSLADVTGFRLHRNILTRVRHTRPQSQLSNSERLSNLQGAFALRSTDGLDKTIKIILVDDVIHTGATARGCLEQLEKAGITDVVVIAACG